VNAIILSAGRGSRLLPLTEARPKCLLAVGGTTVLSHQLDALERAGLARATVVTGFMPSLVEAEIETRSGPMAVETLFNPFYQVADNLASCWMARGAMDTDFLLINGDTIFEDALLEDVLAPAAGPIQVTIDKKRDYDSDDMKVSLEGERLTAIGKTLAAGETDGESIGMLRFTGEGPERFVAKLEQMMRTDEGTSAWFLKAIDHIAKSGGAVMTRSIEGRTWSELDTAEDYDRVKQLFGGASR